ncbi:sigma-70 family RNA polymerase sigma factor [Steroidobacter sp. S1-65]|uniref:Sigma-70 family RNA polymerase sigma factor n=1 Tax=Steroidobacter gossypii TaxID=2805490 RepID=A0ABS1WXN6_9GAMM|nr:sigma-70 family RNA polymerase sigma factor [Steroidobacter gossypii]MBM0105745.1 sigma-70 family RNA polymerase sigma factor [Steroidobacter gossypii]
MSERQHTNNIVRPLFGRKPDRAPDRHATDWRKRFIDDLYRSHRRDLCGLLRRMFGSGPPEPEDLVQGAFQKFSELDNIDHIENPRAFLAKIAVNIGLKSIHRVRHARKYTSEQLGDAEAELEELDPERIYQGRQQLRALDQAMAKLTVKQREIVVRTRLKGETYAYISQACGWSEADICRQLNRALEILADAVDPIERGDKSDQGVDR